MRQRKRLPLSPEEAVPGRRYRYFFAGAGACGVVGAGEVGAEPVVVTGVARLFAVEASLPLAQ